MAVPPVAGGRAAVGAGIALMLDTNCPCSRNEAQAMARRLEPHDPFWLEEPIWPPADFAALAQLRAAAGMPIAAGENAGSAVQFAQMFAAGALDYAQPSATKIRGSRARPEVPALAEAAEVNAVT